MRWFRASLDRRSAVVAVSPTGVVKAGHGRESAPSAGPRVGVARANPPDDGGDHRHGPDLAGGAGHHIPIRPLSPSGRSPHRAPHRGRPDRRRTRVARALVTSRFAGAPSSAHTGGSPRGPRPRSRPRPRSPAGGHRPGPDHRPCCAGRLLRRSLGRGTPPLRSRPWRTRRRRSRGRPPRRGRG